MMSPKRLLSIYDQVLNILNTKVLHIGTASEKLTPETSKKISTIQPRIHWSMKKKKEKDMKGRRRLRDLYEFQLGCRVGTGDYSKKESIISRVFCENNHKSFST